MLLAFTSWYWDMHVALLHPCRIMVSYSTIRDTIAVRSYKLCCRGQGFVPEWVILDTFLLMKLQKWLQWKMFLWEFLDLYFRPWWFVLSLFINCGGHVDIKNLMQLKLVSQLKSKDFHRKFIIFDCKLQISIVWTCIVRLNKLSWDMMRMFLY